MAQNDMVLANQSGLAFRSDLNSALAALVSQNSGATQPSTTYTYQPWADTTAGVLKIRNAANNGWISLYRLDGTFSLVPPEDGAISTAKLADSALAATAAGLLKMADGYLAASAAGRAKMGDGFVTPAKLSQPLTLAASVPSTSGLAIDFTSIPSWVRRVTVMFSGVSTNGTSIPQIQLGTSSGVTTSGYLGSVDTSGAGVAAQTFTTGLALVRTGGAAAAAVRNGLATFVSFGNNTWAGTMLGGQSDLGAMSYAACSITLSGALDRIRITTVNGTDAFDAGSINILYEG